jgi:cyclic 2,3-diphosphoglycerate synthase
MAVIALIDGEHHPAAVREALDRLELAGVVFCGGEEKLAPGPLAEHYGRAVETDPERALRRLASDATAVVDLADEPVLPASAKLRLAALALHLGLRYEAPGLALEPPRYEPVDFDGPKLAVIGTGKRTGKTAVAGHWATLLRDRGVDPVIVCMGRGGPAEPQLADASTALADLLAIDASGGHAASDYLEDAALARVPTIGCRRAGGGLAGAPFTSNVDAGAALAAERSPDLVIFEGSGAALPPVETRRRVLVVAGQQPPELAAGYLNAYRILISDLVVLLDGTREHTDAIRRVKDVPVVEARLKPRAVEPVDGRVAVFTTAPPSAAERIEAALRDEGVDVAHVSTSLARRDELRRELDSLEADTYLVELKAAAIDVVAEAAAERGLRVVLLSNDVDASGLDEQLLELAEAAVGEEVRV